MKTSLSLVLCASLFALGGCGDDDEASLAPGSGEAGQTGNEAGQSANNEAGQSSAAAGTSSGEGGSFAGAPDEEPGAGSGDQDPGAGAPSGGTSGEGTAGTGGLVDPMPGVGGTAGRDPVAGEAGTGTGGPEPPPPLYEVECQASDRAFVRRAILGVLGRNPVSQAEVSLYTDMIEQIDELDGFDASAPRAPGSILRHSRELVLDALFAKPEYASNWEDLYRDFLRVQRIDEQQNAACFGLRTRDGDAASAARVVRDMSPTTGGDGTTFTMADIIAGSIALDDMRPIYTSNLFAMLVKTYAGANAEKVALELSRRRDFGAWFDAVYLNRDTVCLSCHNSEFSVTQTNDPETNRHYPLPGLLEKSLFGSSMGPATYGGYEAGDRLHAALRFTGVVNDCTRLSDNAAADIENKPVCPNGVTTWYRCKSDNAVVCESDPLVQNRNFRPWGWAQPCGQFISPNAIGLDMAFVEARFGNASGLRATVWDVWSALSAGFQKLRDEGLGVQPDGTVPDPDKAFAYLTAMNIAEKAWREVVGTPLTIPTYFPRNAAARDQLQLLTEAFIASNYSNKALLKEIYSSPYVNLESPDVGCGEKYGAPRIFDPWVTAEDDPARRGNSSGDGAVAVSGRTVTRAAYSALGWPLAAYGSLFPNQKGYGQDPIGPNANSSGTRERTFQSEVGFFLKNSEPGFRGLDFQARLGWEDRMGRCEKLPENTEPDLIDNLIQRTSVPGVASVRDLVKVLKDRMMGDASIDPVSEEPALAAILGSPLSADASTLVDPNVSLRRACGVIISSPQFLMLGIAPKDTLEVPRLTPVEATYGSLCENLRSQELPGYLVTCAGNDHSLLVSPSLEPSL